MIKAGSCRSTDVTKLLQKQRRDSQCNGIGLCGILSTGKTSVHLSRNPQGRKFGGITPEIFFRLAASQSLSKIWRAAAAGKIVMRRLISRIFLESVVNASSRQRRGLEATIVRCHKNSWIYWTGTYYWWLLRLTITIPFDSKFQMIAQLFDSIQNEKNEKTLFAQH